MRPDGADVVVDRGGQHNKTQTRQNNWAYERTICISNRECKYLACGPWRKAQLFFLSLSLLCRRLKCARGIWVVLRRFCHGLAAVIIVINSNYNHQHHESWLMILLIIRKVENYNVCTVSNSVFSYFSPKLSECSDTWQKCHAIAWFLLFMDW